MIDSRPGWRRTKIVCTIGPATASATMIDRLVRSGMDVVRLNLSHGSLEEHARYVAMVRQVSERLRTIVSILLDLPGPKYRIGKLGGGQVKLVKGGAVVLTPRGVEGNAGLLPVNLPYLPKDVRAGNLVLLNDGALQLRVLEIDGEEVRCRVLVGGVLAEGKGLVVPGMRPSGPFITQSLRDDILFAAGQHPDYVALSFVGSSADVTGVRDILRQTGADIPIISKIERGDAVANFDSILAASDGIMVARGDMGVEIPLERVPLVQKEVIRKCNRAGKPVITATEMLESMVHSPRPTRAETTDVANAIFDGTDATMLSAETSVGKYPVQAVKMMARIARAAEKRLPYDQMLADRGRWIQPETDELISYNACLTAHRLRAAAIVAFTQSGSTAGRVSKYRPSTPVLALTPNKTVCGRLQLRWGVYPSLIARQRTTEAQFLLGARMAVESGLAKSGNLIVITGGIPVGKTGSTNMLKVEAVD